MRFLKKEKTRELKSKILSLEEVNNSLKEKLTSLEQHHKVADSDTIISRHVLQFAPIGYGIRFAGLDTIMLSDTARKILFNVARPELPLAEFMEMIGPDEREEIEKQFSDNISGKSTIASFEVRLINPLNEKEAKSVQISFMQVQIKDEKAMLFTLHDISRHEKLRKDNARLKEKLDDAERIKNAFLSNISHEIRGPLNSILGFTELLNIGNLTAIEKSEYLKIIKTQSSNLLKLIDDIAELTKFEAGEVKINKTPCNLNILLNELLISFNFEKKNLKKEHLELRVNASDKNGLILYTDTGRLYQLLSNLLSNALKFTEKGSVEFGYIRKDDRRVEFYVKDTGVGLSKDEQIYIFERFERIEETVTRKYEGSGLGLAIARGILKLLGGKIFIDSEPGKGSTFSFSIPFEPLPEEDPVQLIETYQESPSYNWKDKLILIVEDDEINLRFLEALLSDSKAQVIEAKNGNQAVDLCRSIPKVDLILMDIKLPELNGFNATKEIRKFNQNIPIIAQTAFATEDYLQKCLHAGCNDFVTKPIDIETLLRKINAFFV